MKMFRYKKVKNFIPYGRQDISKKDIKEVISVLKSDFLTQGPKVPLFEKAICEKVNSKYAVSTNSATSSLHIACMALGLGPGDYLWTSPISFVASANCALYCGAKVDFVDIDLNTGLISIDHLKSKLINAEKLGKLPKILIPVHLAGSSCDMKSIYDLSQKYGFLIIEDASHAIGGKFFDHYVGSCKYSDITVFSFHPVKIITTGEGGVATTNSINLANKMSELRSHGITKDKTKFVINSINDDWRYEQQQLGFNYRLTDIAAALGISQLKRLDNIVKERNVLFNNYINLFSDLSLKMLDIPTGVYSSLHLAVLRFENLNIQSFLFKNLRDNGIGTQVHYTPIHLQPFYSRFGFKEGDYPNSEKYSKSSLSIPIYPGLKKGDQKRIYKILKQNY